MNDSIAAIIDRLPKRFDLTNVYRACVTHPQLICFEFQNKTCVGMYRLGPLIQQSSAMLLEFPGSWIEIPDPLIITWVTEETLQEDYGDVIIELIPYVQQLEMLIEDQSYGKHAVELNYEVVSALGLKTQTHMI